MKLSPSPEHDEQDRKMIELLKALGMVAPAYPPEMLAARRASFLTQIENQMPATAAEELSLEEQEIVRLLGYLKTAPVKYPPHLLAARRAALLQQMRTEEPSSLLDTLRDSVQRVFSSKPTFPTFRMGLAIAGLLLAALIGSMLFSRVQQSGQPAASGGVEESGHLLPTGAGGIALAICRPEDSAPPCTSRGLASSPNLADQGNGPARPAVSKDALSGRDGAYKAAHVNDGHSGASWVSDSPGSWIKIDLGRVTTFNTVSLQKGIVEAARESDPGQFVIAVALSDVYSDGNSNNDYTEYAQVFNSEEAGFSGSVSHTETIQTQFAPVRARFVKITFEKAGAAISEVGVFLEEPAVLAERPTRRPRDDAPVATLTPLPASTSLPPDTATPLPADIRTPTDTSVPTPSGTSPPVETPTALPTSTLPPADTSTLLPTDPLPSDTPVPSATAVPPTVILPTMQIAPASSGPIVVTGSDQTLIFTCNGNDAIIRGHDNTVTLLGSCSSITVTGNGNRVFWEAGSPIIMNRGNDNIISQR